MASSKVSVVLQPLDGHEFIYILREFRRMLSSCVGPEGGIKIVITPAGYTTYTSSSSRLLHNIILENPVCTYINQIIKSQISAYQDNGLYCGILITSLLESALSREISLPIQQLIKLIEYLASEMQSVFDLDFIKTKIDFTTVKQLLPLVGSILSSKPLCGLTKSEIQHLQLNIVKGFVQTIGRTKGKVVIECSEGSVTESEVFPGILYQINHEEMLISSEKSRKRNVTVLLFNIMLTEENDIKLSENRSVKIEGNVKKNYSFLEESLNFFEEVVKLNIDIVACQKVIDPTLILYLQRRGILVLERLGTDLTVLLENLSGATPVSSIKHCPLNKLSGLIGKIDGVRQIDFGQRHYVLLQMSSGNVATLLCHAPHEEAAIELKVVIKQCLHALDSLMSCPEVVPGAGCFEMSFAVRLMIHVLNKFDSSLWTRSLIESCISWFQIALLFSAGVSNINASQLTVDSVYGHMWKLNKENCCCGIILSDMVKKCGHGDWLQIFSNEGIMLLQNFKLFSNMCSNPFVIKEQSVIDLYMSKQSAIKLSVESCINLLQIGMIVYKP